MKITDLSSESFLVLFSDNLFCDAFIAFVVVKIAAFKGDEEKFCKIFYKYILFIICSIILIFIKKHQLMLQFFFNVMLNSLKQHSLIRVKELL